MGAMASLMYVVEWGRTVKDHGVDLLILLSPAGIISFFILLIGRFKLFHIYIVRLSSHSAFNLQNNGTYLFVPFGTLSKSLL